MHANAPFLSFESLFSHGIVLQVIWNERLLRTHVRTVLNDMVAGHLFSNGGVNSQDHITSEMMTGLSRFYSPSYSTANRISLMPIQASDMVKYFETVNSVADGRPPAQSVEVDSKEV